MSRPGRNGDIPAEHAIRGFHSVNLLLADAEPTGAILTDVLGFTELGREGTLVRYKVEGTAIGGIVDIHAAGGFLPARMGGGSVHHIAFRAADDAAEAEMVKKLDREPRHPHHGAEGPELFPLRLFP